MNLRSFRTRLFLLVLLALLPAGLLVLSSNIQRQRAEREKVKTEALLAAKLAAASQDYYVKQTRQLLATITQFDFLVLADNGGFCRTNFTNLKLLSPDFSDFGLINLDGSIFCHTLDHELKNEVLAPRLMQRITELPRFAMGGLHTNAQTGEPILQFAYPVYDFEGNLFRAVYASLQLPLLTRALAGVPLPEGGVVTVLGKAGKILARYPETTPSPIGTKSPDAAFLRQSFAQSAEVLEADGPNGREIEAISAVTVDGTPFLFVQVTVPRQLLFAEADAQFGGSLIGMLLVGCFVLAGCRWFSERAFVQPVSAMLQTTERIINGDLSARTGIAPGTTELHLLAQRFDVMADSLGKRQRDLQEASAEIQRNNVELEQRVEARTSELQALNQELEAFSYSVSHDLRAPLRHIDGFSNLLASDPAMESAPDAQRYLGLITKSARHMGSLIDNLLSFSKMARQSLHTQTVDFDEMVKCIVEENRLEHPRRNILWTIEPLPQVEGDPALLRQVWVNLLGNAVKYTRDRDPARIDISSREEPGEHVFMVADNGAGFDMKYAQKLFGVFQRLHREDEFEGTGIGLANVRRIIQRHGGRTWAEGDPGKGARFYFSLPKAAA